MVLASAAISCIETSFRVCLEKRAACARVEDDTHNASLVAVYIFLRAAFRLTAVLKIFWGATTPIRKSFCPPSILKTKREEWKILPFFMTWSSCPAEIRDERGSIQENAYTATRLRPFARRRARTVRPDVVFMRTRKPCVFDRFRFFGAYVNDIVHTLLHIYVSLSSYVVTLEQEGWGTCFWSENSSDDEIRIPHRLL